MGVLYDMHCHLDFADKSERIAQESAQAQIAALSCTVVPTSFVSDQDRFAGSENLRVSLGMHPWWVADARVSEADIAHFETLVSEASFIGEIGLDFAERRKGSKDRQLAVLTRLLQAIHGAGDGRIITFHAVHAATPLMDLLDDLGIFQRNRCLFHWFQGSSEELGRAVDRGAVFSVGRRMLATERGSRGAADGPEGQLLLETDEPAHEGSPWSVAAWREQLESTLSALARLRKVSSSHLEAALLENAQALLAHPST